MWYVLINVYVKKIICIIEIYGVVRIILGEKFIKKIFFV